MSSDLAVSYDRFRRHAQRFIGVVDRVRTLPPRAFLLELGASLAELYALALALSAIEPAADGQTGAEDASPRVAAAREVAAVRQGEEVVAYAQLMDDAAVTYGALKAGIVRMGEGAAAEDVLRHWRQTFIAEWGDHATSAMRTIYFLLRAAPVRQGAR